MGKTIELKAKDGFTLAAYKADPAGKPKGGLVVIQEIFGVNHHMRNVTDRFAALGLYRHRARPCSTAPSAASISAMTRRPWRQGAICAPRSSSRTRSSICQAAIDALKGAGKIGVVGYCWGGSLAFLAATRLSGIAAAVGYYGGMIAEPCQGEAEGAGHAAFRRAGPRHSHDRCREGQGGAAGCEDLHLSRRPRLQLRRARQLRQAEP